MHSTKEADKKPTAKEMHLKRSQVEKVGLIFSQRIANELVIISAPPFRISNLI